MIPKRLLCFVSAMDAGGAETFLMKIYRTIDKENYQFDFIVNSEKEGFYDNEIKKMGGRIYYVPPKSKKIFFYIWKTYKIVKENNYDYVLRMTAHSLGTLDLLIAMMAGARHLVMRSTNAGDISGCLSKMLHIMFSWMPKVIPTAKIAPSTEAAEFLFGKGCIDKDEFFLLKNAIPLDCYRYDKNKRNAIREEFNINENLVVGHIGRFNKQKNHKFLIEVFSELVKVKPEARLMLVGKGELEKDIKKQCDELEISNKVIFAGVRKEIPEILMAMDVMVFPSFFEGMPNVIVEAQATGLPCLISDMITEEAKITNLVDYMSIHNKSAEEWAKEATNIIYKNINRELYNKELKSAGYDIKDVVKEFEKIIF